MNALIMPGTDLATVMVQTGDRIPYTHPDITDLWGTSEGVDALLGRHFDDAFSKRELDRISAHIATERGRVFLHRIDTDPWAPPRGNALDSLRLMDRLARLLRVRALHYSPQSRGLSILDFTRAEHPEWFGRELPPNWDNRDSAISPNFTRKIYDRSIVGTWNLHKWDTRAAWLASARTVPVGFGKWRRMPTFEPRSPGIWPVDFPQRKGEKKGTEKPARYPTAPAPIMVPGWYATEIVRAAQERGQDITIGPGQGWGGATTALRSFCERLHRARAGAAGEGGTLEERDWLISSIKAIYTRTFGCLEAYRKSREKLYQPHWYYSLKAESARRMWKLYGASPCIMGLEVDTVYAVAPPDMPPAEILPKGTPTAFNPGTLRYEGCTPVTQELFDMFGGKASRVGEYLRDRNCLEAWEVLA